MNIWVDANGWPIPPTVLLGCLVAEILYFRGWRLLVKAEQAKSPSIKRRATVGPRFIEGNSLVLAQHLLPRRDLHFAARIFCPH